MIANPKLYAGGLRTQIENNLLLFLRALANGWTGPEAAIREQMDQQHFLNKPMASTFLLSMVLPLAAYSYMALVPIIS